MIINIDPQDSGNEYGYTAKLRKLYDLYEAALSKGHDADADMYQSQIANLIFKNIGAYDKLVTKFREFLSNTEMPSELEGIFNKFENGINDTNLVLLRILSEILGTNEINRDIKD